MEIILFPECENVCISTVSQSISISAFRLEPDILLLPPLPRPVLFYFWGLWSIRRTIIFSFTPKTLGSNSKFIHSRGKISAPRFVVIHSSVIHSVSYEASATLYGNSFVTFAFVDVGDGFTFHEGKFYWLFGETNINLVDKKTAMTSIGNSHMVALTLFNLTSLSLCNSKTVHSQGLCSASTIQNKGKDQQSNHSDHKFSCDQ